MIPGNKADRGEILRSEALSIHLFQKNVFGENGEWELSNGNCKTEMNCGFHIWYAKTMSSSRGHKLILPHERPTGCATSFPGSFVFPPEGVVDLAGCVSQTPKKNEASATEF